MITRSQIYLLNYLYIPTFPEVNQNPWIYQNKQKRDKYFGVIEGPQHWTSIGDVCTHETESVHVAEDLEHDLMRVLVDGQLVLSSVKGLKSEISETQTVGHEPYPEISI